MTTTACTRTLPPPDAPPASMPVTEPIPDQDAQSGMARVVIGTDVPARVMRTNGHFDQIVSGKCGSTRTYATDVEVLLCEQTPCTVTLPYGDHDLHFTSIRDLQRTSFTTVRVRHATEVVNHALGQNRSGVGYLLGSMVACVGGLFLGLGLATAAPNTTQSSSSSSSTTETTTILLGTGVGFVVGGLVIWAAMPDVRQEGATTQWAPRSLPAAAPTSPPVNGGAARGASFRVTF